jgi:metal-responsive CopG/Arc/MetJ family transcriptional regulator
MKKKPSEKKKVVNVTVGLTPAEIESLDTLAYVDGSNRSQIIRKALRVYVAQESPK